MIKDSSDQAAHRWLLGALVLDLAGYLASRTAYPEGQSAVPWLLLDLFLFWRVWRGGRKARYVLLVLGGTGVVLGLYFLVAEMTTDSVAGPGWLTVLSLAASTACLLHPAVRSLANAKTELAVEPEREPSGKRGG